MSGPRPLELSGSKDGMDEDERVEVRRVEVLNEVQSGRRTVTAAASISFVNATTSQAQQGGRRRVSACRRRAAWFGFL